MESPPELQAALGETDSDDRRRIYLAWCRLGQFRREIVPLVARAFATTKHAQGRESHLYYVTPYASFDDATVELGVRALADARKEVRYRACGLLARSGRKEVVADLRKIKTGPSRDAAQRAERALLEGKRFGADDDSFYFIEGHEPYRAPRGSFADDLADELGEWLTRRGLLPSHVFQHVFEFRDDARVVRAEWDSYDVEARVLVDGSSTQHAGGTSIAELGKTIRSRVQRT
ncbi:MAG TPA: hypothetical protein VGH63_03550 [Polyangia bacterium]